MQSQHYYIIRERSNVIPIERKISSPVEITSTLTGEYSLKENVFDPSKSSPPNEFMIKLHRRVDRYYLDNKVNSRDIE